MSNPPDISLEPPDQDPGDRRDPAKGRVGDRRRGGWRDFRQAYPGFVFTLLLGLVVMLSLDGFLLMKQRAYEKEVVRLRSNMSDQERAKSEAIIAAEHNKTRIALELARRQAKIAKNLHLSVAVDSGKIYLERDGAVLREIAATFGPEVKAGPDSIPVVIPRGEMTVAKVSDQAIILEGGTQIAATDAASPAQDTTPVPPGSVRISKADLQAILPNLNIGMPVYFY